MQTDVDADRLFRRRERSIFHFAGKAGEPLVVLTTDGAGFGGADQRAVSNHFHRTHLGQFQHITVTSEFAARGNLREGDGVVDASSFESGISWLLASFHPPKEGLEGEINTDGDVLQDLGVNAEEFGVRLFPPGQGCLLLSQGDRLPGCFPEGSALYDEAVVDIPTEGEDAFQGSRLRAGGKQPVLYAMDAVAQEAIIPKHQTPVRSGYSSYSGYHWISRLRIRRRHGLCGLYPYG